jgi:hypothetical protein
MQRTQKPVNFSQLIFLFEAVGAMHAKKLINEKKCKKKKLFRKKGFGRSKKRAK